MKPSMSNAAGIKQLIPPSRAKEYVRRRALWGTKCMDTEEEVKKFLISWVPEATSVEVKHMCKSESSRVRWWFWLTELWRARIYVQRFSPFFSLILCA